MMLVKYPSAFVKVLPSNYAKENLVEFEGDYWDLVEEQSAYYPRTSEDLVRFYPLVVKYAMKKHGVRDGVSVSLPTETYLRDIRNGSRMVEEIKGRIKSETGIENVVVLPQGAISVVKVFTDGELKPIGNTLVIDGGFNTVNICLVDEKGIVLYARSYYNEYGTRNLLEKYFYELITKSFNIPRNLQLLKKFFISGYFIYGLEKVSLEAEKIEAVRRFIPDLVNTVVQDLKVQGHFYDQFVIVGGLSYYIPKSAINTNLPFFIPEKDGEFYTAMGMRLQSDLPTIDFGFGDIKIAI